MQVWFVSAGLAVLFFILWLLVACLFKWSCYQKNAQLSHEHKGKLFTSSVPLKSNMALWCSRPELSLVNAFHLFFLFESVDWQLFFKIQT